MPRPIFDQAAAIAAPRHAVSDAAAVERIDLNRDVGNGIFSVVGGDRFTGELDPVEDGILRDFPVAGFDGDVDAGAIDDQS